MSRVVFLRRYSQRHYAMARFTLLGSPARKRGFLRRSLIYCCLLLAAEGLPVGVLRAGAIQLAPASQLTVDFAMPGFNPNNPGALFPTTIGLELVSRFTKTFTVRLVCRYDKSWQVNLVFHN